MRTTALLTCWDGGLGHVTRLVDIAHSLVGLDLSPKFAVSKVLAPIIAREFGQGAVQIVECRPRCAKPRRDPPNYSHAFGHGQRQHGLKIADFEWLDATLRAYRDAIRATSACLVINDYSDVVFLAARTLEVPTIGIVESSGVPTAPPMGYWRLPEVGERLIPNALDSFNEIAHKWMLRDIHDERELFWGDLGAIASIPTLDPISGESAYLGFPGTRARRMARPIGSDRPKVIVYLGESNRQNVDSIINAVVGLAHSREMEVLYLGGAALERALMEAGHSDHFLGCVGEEEVLTLLEGAGAVVTHGGRTLVAALRLEVPAVVIPWSTADRWWYEAWQLGACVVPEAYDAPLEWRYDPEVGADVAGLWNIEVSTGDILRSLELAMSSDSGSAARSRIARESEGVRLDETVARLVASFV